MMKRLFTVLIALATLQTAGAQDLEAINKLMSSSKFPEAKAAIDKYLESPKNQTDGQAWYLKGSIYSNYSNETSVPAATAYDLKIKALEAYKKSQEVDKLDLLMKTNFYRPYLIVYSGFYNLGAQQFNAKDFEGAYNSFAKADEVRSFIVGRKYTYDEIKFAALDTNLTLNMAAAAINAKNEVNAVKAYRMLADAGLSAKEYEEVYQYLVEYYSRNNDETNLQKYLALGRAKYPQGTFWSSIELDRASKSGDKTALFAKYEEAYKREPNNYNVVYNYAAELYNALYKDSNYPDTATGRDKLTEVLKTAILADTSIEATLVMANHLYNYAASYTDASIAVTGKTPADLQKRKDLNAMAIAKMDEMMPYANLAIKYYTEHPPAKTSQKINLKNMYGYLSDMYDMKKNTVKAEEYTKLKDGVKF